MQFNELKCMLRNWFHRHHYVCTYVHPFLRSRSVLATSCIRVGQDPALDGGDASVDAGVGGPGAPDAPRGDADDGSSAIDRGGQRAYKIMGDKSCLCICVCICATFYSF
jgi:hypothetical protein